MEKEKSIIGFLYKTGTFGVVCCIISLFLALVAFYSENEDLISQSDQLFIIGVFIWGVPLIIAGVRFNKLGLKKTGVLKAGIGLLIWAVILFAFELEDNVNSSEDVYVYILSLIGPAIFYFSLRDPSDENPEKFMTTASKGMKWYLIAGFFEISAIYRAMSSNNFIANFVAENFTTVFTILVLAQIFGLSLCLASMLTYKDFTNDWQWNSSEPDPA